MEEKNVIEFVQDLFKDQYKVIDLKVTPLTKPGDNFLSIMIQVDVVLKNIENSTEKVLNAVAKCVKTTNKFVTEIFPIAFKNEITFYKEVVPALYNFQRERGVQDVIDFFPEFYGARMNKSNGDDVNIIDDGSIILLENLKCIGYQNTDRLQGFNEEGGKIILKDLATLHATALGFKFTKSDEFDKKIRKNCRKAIPPPPPDDHNPYKQPLTVFFEILSEYPQCKPYIPILKQKFSKMREKLNDFYDIPPREPFATLVHCDLWVNNTMQIYKNKRIIKNKFVDFQLFSYQSPVADVLFFLWSSVQLEVLKTDFQNLLKYYHTEFIEQLRKLNCNIHIFSYEKFLEEIDYAAPNNYMDIMYMTLFVVFGRKDIDDSGFVPGENVIKADIPEFARHKIAYMVQEYGKRGWLI